MTEHQLPRPRGGDGDEMTAAWREASTGAEFQECLRARDLTLARDDSGACVVVGPYAGVHELTPASLPGESAASIRAKLRDVDPERLPTVDYMMGLYAPYRAPPRPKPPGPPGHGPRRGRGFHHQDG